MSVTYTYKKNEYITVLVDNDLRIVHAHHPNFESLKEAIRMDDMDAVRIHSDIRTDFAAKLSLEYITVTADAVYYKGEQLHNAVTDKIMALQEEGFDIRPMAAFLQRLKQNPSKRSVDQLYTFLENNHVPIDPDGFIISYKAVHKDYTDYHTRSIDNSVGQYISMERNMVDDNPDNHCSNGYHFAGLSYASDFLCPDGHLMIVKVDPADVVSIPNDHNCAKARCCAYEVIGEHRMKDGSWGEVTDSQVYKEDLDDGWDMDYNNDSDEDWTF